ncbi:MAG: 2,4-dihydroxyhept-2-ene-1,7-dioic acid aldolase [Dehalococcoidia bacterium]|nr:MAG: 2,4-dihydroxyhept-2-ene-1,7-dioic acid aldolase [Dehalococcoidia bacterium]
MRSLPLKQKLQSRQPTFGSWIVSYDVTVAETMAYAGFDWLIFDLEHAPISLERLEAMLMVFKGLDCVPIVRVPWNDITSTKVVLDIGAEAIMLPMINSREEAERAVRLCKFPPRGVRGINPRRANAQGEGDRYLLDANERVMVIVQIEHIDAVEHAEEILTTPGVDVALIGRADLTGSMGLAPDWRNPRVEEAVEHVLATAVRLGIPAALHAADEREAAYWIERGAAMIWTSGDLAYLQSAAVASVRRFRELTAGVAR